MKLNAFFAQGFDTKKETQRQDNVSPNPQVKITKRTTKPKECS